MYTLSQIVLAIAACVVVGTGQAVGADAQAIQMLETKFQGEWTGGSPCDGVLIIKAGGTYQRQHYSPGNDTVDGTWQIKWNALPPTMVMKCASSDNPKRRGEVQEAKIIRLDVDGSTLELQYSADGPVHRFRRADK